MPPSSARAAAAPLAACVIGLIPVGASAVDVARGGLLYQQTRTAPLSCGDNGACHGPDPSQDVYQIRRGADDAARIESAIARNRGGMGFLAEHVDAADLADIAAWIGAVVAGREVAVAPAVTPATGLGTAGSGGPDGTGGAVAVVDPAAGATEPTLASPFNAGYGGCSSVHDGAPDPMLPGLALLAAAALARRRSRPRAGGGAPRRAVLAAALAAGALAAGGARAYPSGTPAPAFDLPTADGARVSLSALRGRVVYVDFWASWCAPCRRSFPWMNAVQRRLGPLGLQVVAINVDTRPEDARRFLAAVPAEFTVALDPRGTAPGTYAIRAMPTSVIVGRDGTVLHVHAGFRDADAADLEARLAAALAAPRPADLEAADRTRAATAVGRGDERESR